MMKNIYQSLKFRVVPTTVILGILLMCTACGTYEPRTSVINADPTEPVVENVHETAAPSVSSDIKEKATKAPVAKKSKKDKEAETEATSTAKPISAPTATPKVKKKSSKKTAVSTKKPSKSTDKKKTPAPTEAPRATVSPTKVPTAVPTKQPDKTVRLFINEIMSSNGTIADAYGKHEDWIEIYNDSEISVNLKNYFLSDNKLKPYKWTFPNVSIPAKGYMVVWLSGKNTIDLKGEVHTSFKLNKAGEDIILTSADKSKVVDSVGATAVERDKSWGRTTDGSSTWKLFSVATPGQPNK